MARAVFWIGAAAAMLLPADANGTTIVLADGTREPAPYQRWADRAHVVTPPGFIRLTLTERACGGYVCAQPWKSPPIIHLFDAQDRLTHFDFLHELGHVVSYRRPALRTAFARIFGYFDDEHFAMGYSWCAVNTRWRTRVYPGYAYEPTLRQHRRLCAAFGR